MALNLAPYCRWTLRDKAAQRRLALLQGLPLGITKTSMPLLNCFDLNALSAIANAVTAAGIFLALWQLRITKSVAQLQFEDSLAKEYRDLAARIPTKAFYGTTLSEAEHRQSRDEFFRYIDLSNEQVALRKRNRISKNVWVSWCAGIEYNLNLPAFRKAWDEIKERTSSFEELRLLESQKFETDPRCWRNA